MKYIPQKIESKWQKFWQEEKLFQAKNFDKKPKKYFLVEFPYPSGDGLHVGHIRSYAALDILSRQKRMQGFNVLYPIGWDAFGLPTENYALKTGIHPTDVTKKNIKVFKKQLQLLGLSFDWSREINTTDPAYYQWTQWIFLKFFEKGLAYQSEMPINWCPSCKIGLANEEVIDGQCERCGAQTERRKIKQWMLKITEYADRLIEDLEQVDYLEKIKIQQKNWIGRSEGTEIIFKIKNSNLEVKVFTTRVDTIFGVTALVVAPEHEIIKNLEASIENIEEVKKYVETARKKSELERTDLAKEKTGVELKGIKVINPLSNEEISVWVGDYVIASYGGGAVMMVPAHDQRDFEFAKKYNLLIKQVISKTQNSKLKTQNQNSDLKTLEKVFIEDGTLVNSGQFSGLGSAEARQKINQWLENKNLGKKVIQYKLRDWIFSRQHYWGEPMPIIHCQKCGVVAVSEKDLPVKLPYVEKYEPSGTGQSPLAKINKWVNVKCPKCGGKAKRETDTMPNWAGSNWYYLAYLLGNKNLKIKNKKLAWDKEKIKYWMPVDWYNGGMEHTTLHLLYSRFVYKFLYDLGIVSQPEPYQKRTAHGMILAEDGQKMSKSRGNVINPDAIVKKYGADSLRLYEMFMGPFDQAINWNIQGLIGCFRFLNRVWELQNKLKTQNSNVKIKTKNFLFGTDQSRGEKIERLLNKTIKKISDDLEEMKFNTAVAALMILVNEMEKEKNISRDIFEKFLIIFSPFAPHFAEELWQKLGHQKSIFLARWPEVDKKYLIEDKINFVVQINGRVREIIKIKNDLSEEEIKKLVLNSEKIKKYFVGKKIKKIIFVSNKLINFVLN